MEKQYSAGGLVIWNDAKGLKVLLIKDSYGRWTWPKGHIEKGETPEIAAKREIKEETGLSSTNIEAKLGEQKYYFTLKGERIFKTVHIFLVRHEGAGKIAIDRNEIKKAAWFSAGDALKKIEYRGSKKLLEKGIKKFREKYR